MTAGSWYGGGNDRPPPSIIMVCDLPAWPCGCPLLAEAIAAVNRAVATWLKRDRGILATFCADHGMHLTRALAVAITALVTSCLTARITALGLVGELLSDNSWQENSHQYRGRLRESGGHTRTLCRVLRGHKRHYRESDAGVQTIYHVRIVTHIAGD